MTKKTSARRNPLSIASSSWAVAVFGTVLALLGGAVLCTEGRDGTEKSAAAPSEAAPPDVVSYEEREARFANDEIRLAGTLTRPQDPGRVPALVLTTGSGPQNRDAELNGRAYHADLARELIRYGIAVLRFDDRGVGESTGNLREATLDDLAGDAWEAVRWLRRQPDIDPDRIGLYGPSEGSAVVAQVAAAHSEVTYLVLTSAPGLPGRELMIAQHVAVARSMGLNKAAVEEVEQLVTRSFDISQSARLEDAKNEEILPLARRLDTLMSGDPLVALAPTDAAERMVDMLLSPAMQDRLRADPRPALRGIKVPTLLVHGERDLQVDPAVHLPAIEAAFRASGHSDYEVVLLAGHNHMLEPSETGLPDEYGKNPRSPRLVEIIGTWINRRFADGGRGA